MLKTNADSLTEFDLYLLREGTHYCSYEKMGAHVGLSNGVAGTTFAVWAPNAASVSVIGDFNSWNNSSHVMQNKDYSGVWELFVPGVTEGELYKYHIVSSVGGYSVDKADPYGFAAELRPRTASKVWNVDKYKWHDLQWMSSRSERNNINAPISIYEVHLGSWMRCPEQGNRWLSYRELASILSAYVVKMGFTHVEFLPVSEHPFDASWGYQTVGYFAPTSRFGSPDDFKYLVDCLHQNGIGVILDWVPGHFPYDEHGIGFFDGTHLFEHSDPKQRVHPDWDTSIFNYGRHEVANFLISNALFWLEKYHIDGLRVDAVASMLYLDYSRKEGEWIPNPYGGRENIEAINFLRKFNEQVYSKFPGIITIAEESTAWPMVSRPTYVGGLGFGLKWDMGWMHDTLLYMSHNPVHRKYHHDEITFRGLYAFTENFVLPLSHDEVVHGKGSLLSKMPGDDWQKFANLRLLYGYMYGQAGKKLLFMGGEFAQWSEWKHDVSLDWHLLDYSPHQGVQLWVRNLNEIYRRMPALHSHDCSWEGYRWIDGSDADQSVLAWLRVGSDSNDLVLVVCNFTPVVRYHYNIGVPQSGYWEELLNSDASIYGGSNCGNNGGVSTVDVPNHGYGQSLSLVLPPLSILFLGAPAKKWGPR